MKNPKIASFYHDKPIFGLDIGQSSLKVMQMADMPTGVVPKNHKPRVLGYGFAAFDKTALEDGVVVKPEIVAQAAQDLFKNQLIGEINTRRVALAIPAYRTFTRAVQMPKLGKKELAEAVQLEAEQYVSMPLDQLYLDYELIRESEDTVDLFMVAVPKEIVDSYLDLAQILGLETVLIEPTLSSSGRLFSIDSQSDVATFIIDFGSRSSDISIFDKHVLVTGTVQGGGESFTNSIMSSLGVGQQEAGLIKTKYGLGLSKRQSEIQQALEPTLVQILKEIRRMMRYYEERYGTDRPIGQIVTLGGGANMPGLSEYFTASLRMPVRHTDPWQYLDYKDLQPPPSADKPMYATVAGLSLTPPRGVFPL
jgi:type IV pilus assembly protein PilM